MTEKKTCFKKSSEDSLLFMYAIADNIDIEIKKINIGRFLILSPRIYTSIISIIITSIYKLSNSISNIVIDINELENFRHFTPP